MEQDQVSEYLERRAQQALEKALAKEAARQAQEREPWASESIAEPPIPPQKLP